MNELTIDILIENLIYCKPEEIEKVRKAYNFAEALHRGQKRESGEDYIIHPLNVAYILSEMHAEADVDTICAALLHDTIEDTKITRGEIAEEFGEEVAKLVDGVTKISKLEFYTEADYNLANTRKIILSIIEDIRIIIIKLVDRLHNMRTLEYKTTSKQKEKALETMEIYVPLAHLIGAEKIETELADISFGYLKPGVYKRIDDKKRKIEESNRECLEEILFKIKRMLEDRNIPNEIKVRAKSIYAIYMKLKGGHKFLDIHDLIALKTIVDELENCYLVKNLIHNAYTPIEEKYIDYISDPVTNTHRSIHTTVLGLNNRPVEIQIRTFEMDKVALYGITALWSIHNGNARDVMQRELREKYSIYQSVVEIDEMFRGNKDFLDQIKREVFAAKVKIYTPAGEIIELPVGSTPIDFAYKIHTDVGDAMTRAFVNGKEVEVGYKLQNKDRVVIVTDSLSPSDKEGWDSIAQTAYAKKYIRNFQNQIQS